MSNKVLSVIVLLTIFVACLSGGFSYAAENRIDGVYSFACVSNISDKGSLDLYIQNSTAFIRPDDAAILSGYTVKSTQPGKVVFFRQGNQAEQNICVSYKGEVWVEFQDTMNKLMTHVQQEKGLLLFIARKNTAQDLFAITDPYMTQGLYNLSDNSNLMLDALTVAATIYNRLVRQQFIETITGKYDAGRYYDVMKMVINHEGNSDLLSIFKDGDKIAKQLGTLQRYQYGNLSEEELMDLYRRGEIGDWGAVISVYKNITNPVDYFLKKAVGKNYSVGGLDIFSQIDLYKTINAFMNCEDMYTNIVVYTFSADAYKTAIKGVSLTPEERMVGLFATFPECYLPGTANNAVKEMIRFSKAVTYEDILAEVARKEIGTVTVETLYSYLKKTIENPYGVLISIQKIVNDMLFKKTVDMIDYMETYSYLANLQKGLPGLYQRYKACDKTVINAKYTTLLYLRLVQAAYEDCVEKGIINAEDHNVGKAVDDAILAIANISDSDLLPFVPDDGINIKEMIEFSIRTETMETMIEDTTPEAEAEPVDYSVQEEDDEGYSVRFDGLAAWWFKNEIDIFLYQQGLDEQYHRTNNSVAVAMPGEVSLGAEMSAWLDELKGSTEYFSTYCNIIEQSYGAYDFTGKSVKLVESEVLGWGGSDGNPLIRDEYYLFTIATDNIVVDQICLRVQGDSTGRRVAEAKSYATGEYYHNSNEQIITDTDSILTESEPMIQEPESENVELYPQNTIPPEPVSENNMYYSDTESFFYSDSLYALFNGCSDKQYKEEVGNYDRELGRRINNFAHIDEGDIGYCGNYGLSDFSAIGLLNALLNHDWYEPYSSGVESIITAGSNVTLIQSELYGWGMIDGAYVLCDEYYRFGILNETSYGYDLYDVLFRTGYEMDGGEWSEGRILNYEQIGLENEYDYQNENGENDVEDGGYIIQNGLYGPGTENPTLSPYHENYTDNTPWYEAIAFDYDVAIYSMPDVDSDVLLYLPIKALLQTCYFNDEYSYVRYNRYEGFVLNERIDSERWLKYMETDAYMGQMEVVNCNESVSLRELPNSQYRSIIQVPLGAIVDAYYYNEHFYECEYNGYHGYIMTDYLWEINDDYIDYYSDEEYPDDPGYFIGTLTVTNCDEWVSLREYPDSSSARVAEIPKWTELDAYYYSDQWYFVFYGDYCGYVLSDYLE